MRDDFATFILSHGRPENVGITIRTLRKANYSGRWYIVLDTDDTSADQYRARWGNDRILTFSKTEIAKTFDLADNGGSPAASVFARNAIELLAADLGLTYYLQLDDDYTHIAHRFATTADGEAVADDAILNNTSLANVHVRDLDGVLDALIDFLDDSGALTVAVAQAGEFLGGVSVTSRWRRDPMLRKAMNTFICRVGRPINFVGRLNEDVNTYVWRGSQGELFFTVMDVAISQVLTQSQSGGVTDAYLASGTYRKSFYTVMMAPSCTTISTIGRSQHRIHHHIVWKNAVPKIVSSTYKR